tara:strand:- start:438 stop:1475 length:1038 start_codon:yes stop_codon:yes gene_type:complete
MANRQILLKASAKKNDEYYTLWDDVSAEVSRYKNQLKGKRILCPCDWDESFYEQIVYKEEGFIPPSNLLDKGGSIKSIDVKKSKKKIEKDLSLINCNFVKFLVAQAEEYKIKSVSVSGYDPLTGKGVRYQDIDYSKYDLIITNPPFSLFGDFIETLFKNKMKFLVIGPAFALTYKEIFIKIKENKMWLGYAKQLSGFRLIDGTLISAKQKKEGSVPRGCKWYTNLNVSYRNDKMILNEEYSSKSYPKYYNYDAIEVNKTDKIPKDYKGEMGVPTTFLTRYNPKQFKIIAKGVQTKKTKNFKGDRAALWIKGEHPKGIEKTKVININGKKIKMYAPFERILIKNKQ